MTPHARIRLLRAPVTVAVQQPAPGGWPPVPTPEQVLQAARADAHREVEARGHALELAAQALVQARQGLLDFRDELRQEAERNLLDLSLEIARKVLMQEIQAGRYEIEPIVREALSHVGHSGEVEVRLNPNDLACLRGQEDAEPPRHGEEEREETQEAQEERTLHASADRRALPPGLNLIADASVGRGECVLRTAQGVVESRIEAHLEEIGHALRD